MEPSSRVNQDLEVTLIELADLPQRAEEDWDPERANDEQDAYESYWPTLALDKMDDLERAYSSGSMSAEQETRYTELKALFRERMPLIERYRLEKPTVPLDDAGGGKGSMEGGRGEVRWELTT